jgi:glycosyltransferase involved in cell wall biosynthesis
MHVGLIAQGGAGWMGGVEYIRNLVRAIAASSERIGEHVKVSAIYGEKQKAAWTGTIEAAEIMVGKRGRGWPLVGRYFPPGNQHFLRAVEAGSCDFIYPLTYDNRYNVEVTLPLKRGQPRFRWAGWIPDFQHRHLPQLFSADEIAKRDRGIELLLREAPRVVLSSQTAVEDLRRFHPHFAHKGEVLTFATFAPPEWYSSNGGEDVSWLPDRFFLVSNQFWKHKNHMAIFEALHLLRGKGIHPMVVCTGQLQDFRDPDYTNVILQSLHKMGIAGQVLLLGLVERRTQIEMMRRCLAVVQPSLFEGWSTVVEDARVMGKPCLLSDIPVHREQDPPGARFFDPCAPQDLADRLAEAWETLRPGPDAAAEAVARTNGEARIAEVGRTFLEIARRTCAAN